VKEILLETIGKIGSPKSYDAIISQIQDGENLTAVKALGGIRDARVAGILGSFSEKYYWRNQESYFEALGNTRDARWLPLLNNETSGGHSRSHTVAKAIKMIKFAESCLTH